jgi:hypothetical protein
LDFGFWILDCQNPQSSDPDSNALIQSNPASVKSKVRTQKSKAAKLAATQCGSFSHGAGRPNLPEETFRL